MRRTLKKTLLMTAAVLALAGALIINAGAYFNRGPVGCSVGRSAVTITAGDSVSVSVSFSPSSSSQLPGCGMAECPQSCGEKECLDENGECTCNGKEYQTYYAYATVSSGNTGVATADYSGGVVTIYGVSEGTATITVTSALRQFSGQSDYISVTVTAPAQAEPDPQPSGGGSGGSSSSESGGVTVKPVSGGETASGSTGTAGTAGTDKPADSQTEAVDKNEEKKPGEEEKNENKDPLADYTTLNSDRGPIVFVPATDAATVGKVLEAVKGQAIYADFQCKDMAETILYAWEYYGMNVSDAKEKDLTVETGMGPVEGIKQEDIAWVRVPGEGALPNSPSLYVRVADWFENDRMLHVYRYEEDGSLTSLSNNAVVLNGYVTLQPDMAGVMLLSQDELTVKPAEAGTQEQTAPAGDKASENTEKPVQESEAEANDNQTEAAPAQSKSSLLGPLCAVGAVAVLAAGGVMLLKKKKPSGK